jgi:hypothetical protein
MGQHGLVAFERHQRESDADAAVADFLGLKTSGAFWQIFATRLISVVLPQPGRPVSKFSVSSQAR